MLLSNSQFWWSKLVLAFIVTGATQGALAQVCPSIHQLGQIENSVLQSAVDNAVPQCLEQADFLALKGRLALDGGDFEGAITWLEKATMVAPDQPFILLEYAHAARVTGDLSLARGIVEDLLLRSDMPVSLRSDLQAWLLTFRNQSMALVRQRVSWSAGLGHDSNINSGSSQSSLTLTLPSGDWQLGLDPKLIAKSSPYLLGQGTWLGTYKQSDWAEFMQVRIQGQAKQPLGQSENYAQQTVDFELALTHPHWLPGLRAQWLRLQHVEYAGQGLVTGASTGLVWGASPIVNEWHQMACRAEKGWDLEHRYYAIDASLSGLAPGITYAMLCQNNILWTLIQARAQWDIPVYGSGQRAGGQFVRTGIVAALGVTQKRWSHQVVTRLDYQQDIDSYSIFIQNGDKRYLLSTNIMLESSYQINPGFKGIFRLESRSQSSNISLFSLRSQGVYLGLSYDF